MSNMQQSSMSHDNNHHHWSMISSLDFHPSMLQNSPGLLTALEEDSMFQPLVSISLSKLFCHFFSVCLYCVCVCVGMCVCARVCVPALFLAPSSAPNSHARERQRVY